MIEESKSIAILILAAGGSSRMGEPKQLLPIDNETLLTRTIRIAKSVPNTDLSVVLGAQSTTIRKSIHETDIQLIVNENWHNGIGSSISKGVSEIKASGYQGVVILLADQPKVDASHVTKLIQAFKANPHRIVATAYAKNIGVPALFGEPFMQGLIDLNADQGAQNLLKKNHPLVIEPPTYFDDLDTPEAYQKFIASGQNSKSAPSSK